MSDAFEYVFPAIRGVQAKREFYVSQCPLRLIPRLFQFDDPDLPAQVRAQRGLNRNRLPELRDYLIENADSYVFSALTASVDAEVRFEPVVGQGEASRIGTLRIPMDARFIINDGQHRRAAIELALEEEPSLGEETIAVVFFLDRGLQRCQQMFADLNRYAVRPSASIGVLFDHRDPLATISRSVVSSSSLFGDVVETERSSLSKKSRKLFTLSALHAATKALLAGVEEAEVTNDLESYVAEVVAFWEGIARAFPEWGMVHRREITAAEVRQDFIHTFSVVLHALAKVGAERWIDGQKDWAAMGERLASLDFSRSNGEIWEGRALSAGRVSKGGRSVLLTAIAIKMHLGMQLSMEEQHAEALHAGGVS